MKLRPVVFNQQNNKDNKSWFIWSINEKSVSCLPYDHITDDLFVFDIKDFPIDIIDCVGMDHSQWTSRTV